LPVKILFQQTTCNYPLSFEICRRKQEKNGGIKVLANENNKCDDFSFCGPSFRAKIFHNADYEHPNDRVNDNGQVLAALTHIKSQKHVLPVVFTYWKIVSVLLIVSKFVSFIHVLRY